MNKEKIIKEINDEIDRIESNDNRDPGSAYWAGYLTKNLGIIKFLVKNYDEKKASLFK